MIVSHQIFYPDLIDKRNTPEYFLTPSSENEEFGVLRFHAGPPYEVGETVTSCYSKRLVIPKVPYSEL